jgi:YesN/AraC family two-component response regulator
VEALARLEAETTFDIVFSDVVMPGVGGVELAKTIRTRWPAVSVILTSGYSHVLALDANHGFPLLHKPYSVEELSHILRQGRSVRALSRDPA